MTEQINDSIVLPDNSPQSTKNMKLLENKQQRDILTTNGLERSVSSR